MNGQLNGQLSLLEAKRWSPATVVAFLQMPASTARTYAVATALGNGISRQGSRASFSGGKDQVASVISATKPKRICAVLGVTPRYFSDFARDCEQRYHVGHRCETGVLCLWITPFMEYCPGCGKEVLMTESPGRVARNYQDAMTQSPGQIVPVRGDALRDGEGDAQEHVG